MENEQDFSDYSSNGSEPIEPEPIPEPVKKTKKQEEEEKKARNLARLEALKKAREVKKKLAEERRKVKENPITPEPIVAPAPKKSKEPAPVIPTVFKESTTEPVALEVKPKKPRNIKKPKKEVEEELIEEEITPPSEPVAPKIKKLEPKAPKVIHERDVIYVVREKVPEEEKPVKAKAPTPRTALGVEQVPRQSKLTKKNWRNPEPAQYEYDPGAEALEEQFNGRNFDLARIGRMIFN